MLCPTVTVLCVLFFPKLIVCVCVYTRYLCIILGFCVCLGPAVAGYLTAGTGATVLSSVPPPVDNDIGDLG